MLNQAHFHLLVNHFPVIGFVFSLIVAVYALGRGSFEGLRISWILSIISAAMALVAYLTGDGAAHILKKFPEVVRAPIGPHADMAEAGLYIALIGAAISLVALTISYLKEDLSKWWKIIIFVHQLVSVSVLGYASHLGGLIRHTEMNEQNPVLIADPDSEHDHAAAPELAPEAK